MHDFTILPGELVKIERDMAPENDFPRTPCRFSYLICSTPRSGSWLLATGLASTGAAGRPSEFFSPPYVQAYLARTGRTGAVSQRSPYMRFLKAHRTSPNGVFGMKMHFSHLAMTFAGADDQAAFLGAFHRFIYLTRRNKVAQAVSFWKALSTSVYRVERGDAADEGPEAAYSFPGIAERLHAIADQERDWCDRLSPFRDRTYALHYEDLASRYVENLEQVLTALDLAEAIPALDPEPQVLAQQDETSRRWEHRFRHDLRCAESRFDPATSAIFEGEQ